MRKALLFIFLLTFLPLADAASLTLNGGSITLDGTQTYDSVSLTNGAVLYITPYDGTGTRGTLILKVSGDVNIDSASKIIGDARGYTGGAGGPTGDAGAAYGGVGSSPAGTNGGGAGGSRDYQYDGRSSGGGGGGGGYAFAGNIGTNGGGVYGPGAGGAGGSSYGDSQLSTWHMGSGGGGGGGSVHAGGGAGGAGGGLIVINATTINIAGTISANGGNGFAGSAADGAGGGGGGGAGGSVYLFASSVTITGSVSALGGNGGTGGAGSYSSGGNGGTGSGGRFKVSYRGTYATAGATISAGSVYSEQLPNTLPTVPGLIPHGSYHISESTTVSWQTSTDADDDQVTYDVKVGTTSGGNNIINQVGGGTTGATSSTSSDIFTMVPTYTYYWSVRACDGYGCSNWADESSFGFGNTAPTVPSVSFPAADSYTNNNTVNITWSQSTDSDGDSPITYTYQLAKDSGFTQMVSESSTTDRYSGNIDIINDGDYYIRVKAYDGIDYSFWSATSHFTKSSPASAFSCTLTTGSCSSPKVTVFRMDNTANSHAGTYTALSYPYKVCCTDLRNSLSVLVLGTSEESNCNPIKQGRVISLNNVFNAHAEEYGLSNYNSNICLSSSAGNLTCTYRSLCNTGETCLASLSGNTNAHVGDCSAYAKKICCNLEYGPYVASGPTDVQVKVGEQSMVIITLTNSLPVPDTYYLELSATPSKLASWMWFNGHRYDDEKMNTSVTIEPGKSTGVAIIVFGGASTSGTMNINVKSAANGLSTRISKTVSVIYAPEEGAFVQTPEFGWFGYVIIGILAALLLV